MTRASTLMRPRSEGLLRPLASESSPKLLPSLAHGNSRQDPFMGVVIQVLTWVGCLAHGTEPMPGVGFRSWRVMGFSMTVTSLLSACCRGHEKAPAPPATPRLRRALWCHQYLLDPVGSDASRAGLQSPDLRVIERGLRHSHNTNFSHNTLAKFSQHVSQHGHRNSRDSAGHWWTAKSPRLAEAKGFMEVLRP